MTNKVLALAAVAILLLVQRPIAQGPSPASIYFIDIRTGASTLIVSPTGTTLLVDGGPDGSSAKISALMTTLGIATIDYTVVTHYHIDHISGITELLNAGKVLGTAFDNGDGADVQPPGTLTSLASTRGHYLNYVTATGHPSVTRQTVNTGQSIDLGGGMRATFMAAGGRLLSGGSVPITTEDLNSESVSVLIEYNNFDYLVSGDLTGGGSTATAKTPDVETYVGQMVRDVDVVQFDHHGSTTANNQVFLAALKAEVAFAQTGETNTFGHPNRETINKYLNTPASTGNTFAGTGVPAAGAGPVSYQNEASSSGDDRVTQQDYTGAAAGNGGQGTVLLQTDGTTTYSMTSFDDGGVRLNSATHTYAVDGASAGLTANFPPTVILSTSPVAPLATDAVVVSAVVNDLEDPIGNVVLNYSVNGTAQSPVTMTLSGPVYQATIPAQADGTRVDYAISATAGGRTTTYVGGYFSGTTPISSLRVLNAKGEPLYFNYAARIQGTVTASGFSSGTNDDYVQDATGGINLYRSSDTPTPFTSTTPGQIVSAIGRVGFLGGRLRFDITESLEKASSPYSVTPLSTGATPTPATVTIAQLNANPESFEGQFVSIANVTITSGSIPATPQPFDAFAVVSDGTGTFVMKIDHDTDVEGFNPGSPFTVAGIIQQDDFLRPFDSSYDITPRSRVDLGAAAPAPQPLLTIAEAREDTVTNVTGDPPADFVPDRFNQIVRVQGTISSIDFRGGNGIEYYIQDATGGIDLFSTSLNAGPFAIGDNVEAIGQVTQFNGLTELTVSSVSSLGAGTAPTPLVLTLAQISDGGLGETYEGQLIQINNVTITAGLFPGTNASGNVTIGDGTGTGVLRVDSDTNIDGTATPGNTFALVGLLGQFDQASPFDSSYQVLPRSLADLVGAAGGGPALTATPGTLAFGGINVGSASALSVTLTNNTASSMTLNVPTVTGTDAGQFQAGSPATTTLAAGASTTAQVTFLPTSAGSKTATLNVTASPSGSATVSMTGTGNAVGGGGAGAIVISEFRTRGPFGGNDEFVEIYNNSDSPVDISGWKLMGSNNTAPTGTRATVPSGVVLAGRTHYLFVNTAASGYSGTVPGNVSYTTGFGDNGGAAITLPDNTIVDQVGVQTTGTGFREGNPLTTQLTTNVARSYERKPGGPATTLQDTNDNATDFVLLTPSTPASLGITSTPAAIDYGSVTVGNAATQAVTIKSNFIAAATVTLDGPQITGTDAASFTAAPPSTSTIAGGATATVNVTFAPTSVGSKSATLTISSPTGGSTTTTLAGLGACAPITVTGTFGAGQVGVAYSASASASGGVGSYSFSTTGTTPPGITIASDGGASGTPTAAGSFTFNVLATTNDGCTGSANFTVSIAKGTVTITWPPPAPIVYGTALGGTQLNATASAPGTITYAPPAGTVLLAGNTQTLHVSFTPDDPANYDPTSASVTIDVAKAPLSVTANDASREFGAPNPAFTGTLTGVVNADNITATYASAATATSPVGTYPIVPTLVDPGGRLPNYIVTITNGTLTVRDTTAPSVPVLTARPSVLGPPNHKMVNVTVTAQSTDAASPATCAISGITSSEPDNGLGDGDASNDIGPFSELSASLRAERSGSGNGRVYTVTVRCHDASGNTSSSTIDVVVPKGK